MINRYSQTIFTFVQLLHQEGVYSANRSYNLRHGGKTM